MKLTNSSSMEIKTTKSRLNKMALPLLLAHITHILYGFGDQAIIGHTSLNEFAGVSLVANILFMLTGSMGIIALTLNIIGSRHLASGQTDKYEKLLNTTMFISLVIGSVFSLLTIIWGKSLLTSVFQLKGRVLQAGFDYLIVANVGLLLNILLFNFSAHLKSYEKTKIIFYGTLLSSVFNLIIDYVLVFGALGFPKLGVQGAAIGTILGLMLNLLVYLYVFYSKTSVRLNFKFDYQTAKEIIKSYLPLLGQDLVESTAFTFFVMIMVSNISPLAVGIYGLITAVVHWIKLPIYSYCNASLTIFSKLLAVNDTSKIKITMRVLLVEVGKLVMAISLIFILLPYQLLGLITDDLALLNSSAQLLWLPILLNLFNIPSLAYKYLLNAIQYETWVAKYTIVLNLCGLLVIYIISYLLKFDLIGIFIGLGLTNCLGALGYWFKYTKLVKNNKKNLAV